MTKKFFALLLALLAPTFLLAACGDDDEDAAADDTSAEVTEDETETETEEEEVEADEPEVAVIDQANLEAFIAAINADPSIICDPDNATEDFLTAMGGEEACLETMAGETGGEPYEITDMAIDGDTAVVTIEDETSSSEVLFVQEGDQLKMAG